MQSAFGKLVGGFVVAIFAACGGVVDEPREGAYSGHAESSDFDPAPSLPGKADDISPVFDANHIVSDAFFTDGDAMSAAEIQAFLEDTPYGNRTWLADESVAGQRVSDLIADTARRYGIHPMMILSRFQVEGSHISRSSHPGSRSANRALGCGCFDGESCRRAYLGVGRQIACATDTMRKRYDGSVDASWEWRRGRAKSSLDGIRVVPSNHATAALYAYTPWVLRGRGGNWLVWNITKKFLAHTPEAGTVGPTNPTNPDVPLWVGAPCSTDDECGFADNGAHGFCYDFVDVSDGTTKGFCSLVCEGFCPDRAGAPTTFCIEADVGGVGICASKSEPLNNHCDDVPGTVPAEADRWIGESSASAGTATVCRPND